VTQIPADEKDWTVMTKTAKNSSPILGRWKIVEMPDFDEEYLNAEGQPHVRFDQDDMGEFHFGYVHGNMDYRPVERDGRPAVEWSWDGNDECDPAQGRGWAMLRDDGMLVGTIFFHLGDEHAFRAERLPGGAKPKKRRAFAILAGRKLRAIKL
jgi:hypothetical protein